MLPLPNLTTAKFSNESTPLAGFTRPNSSVGGATGILHVLAGGAVPNTPANEQLVPGATVKVYCAPTLCGLGLVENTTKSILVIAGIVTWNIVTNGGEPLLVPGSPKYLAAVPISPATNGARYAAT